MEKNSGVNGTKDNTTKDVDAQTDLQRQQSNIATEQQFIEPKSHKKISNRLLFSILAGLVFVSLGLAGYFAYQNTQLRNEQLKDFPEAPTATPTTSPYIKNGVYSPITEENDWGHITVKQLGNELNAMTPARFIISNLPTTVTLSRYMEEENTCPKLIYQLQDNENYTLFLLLPHTGLRPSTEQVDEVVALNGKSFTKISNFTDNKLTAIYYKSEPLVINYNNIPLEYTWDAYLTADNDIGIDESIASAAEAVIGQVEVKEINDSDLTVCQIKQQSQ